MTNDFFKCVLSIVLVVAATAACAQDRLIGFHTPSKNIACQFYDLDGTATLRCDIMEIAAELRRPADCEEEWGHSFEVSVRGSADRVCAGDTVNDPSLPVLGYGEVWQHAGFTCRSDETGLICFNAMQHGFSLSRATQRMF